MKKSARKALVAFLLTIALLCSAAVAEQGELEGAVDETIVEVGGDAQPLEIESEAVEADKDYVTDEDFALDVNELTLGVGEKYELYPASGGAIPVYESSNKKIAKVEKDGTVRGVKVGTCTIYATRNGITDTCEVTVKKAPKSVTMNYKTITLGYDAVLGLGESFDLGISIPEDSWSNTIALSGYSNKIVEVDEDNTVTAMGIGSTKITAKAYNGKKATVKITVVAAPDYMTFDHASLSMGVGSKQKLKLVMPKKTGGNMNIYSEDPDIAKINSDGMVTAVSEGSTTIYAECFNGLTATCPVEVVPAPSWIAAEPETIALGVGETAAITVTSDVDELSGGLTFTSSRKSYASVTADGVVKGVKKGSATINVSTYNNRTDSVAVQVYKAPSSITLNKKTLNMGVGDVEQLVATLSKDSYGSYSWETSNPAVVEVDGDGNLYAEGTGKAKITVRTYNKKTATCDVTVMAPVDAILMEETLTMNKGESVTLPVLVLDTTGNEYAGNVHVTFEPKGIVSLTNGKLKATKAGITVMTVAAGELSQDCVITVESPYSPTPSYGSGTQVIAHRGGVGDSGEDENTLAAFLVALNSGADGVELDVHSTKDGVQVINHDNTFKVGSKTYTIKKLKYSEIRSKKPSIPTLDEALGVLNEIGANIHLELKDSADGKKCVQAIRDHGLEDRTIYFGFYETPLKAVRKADSTAILGLSLDKNTNPTSSSVLKKVDSLGVTILVTNMAQLTESRLETLHDMGYEVSVWTPNTRSACQKFYDMGVDYILTDHPSYIER